ncbi:MAG: hypothetical protein GEV05_27610 [Betaproteobacteria bacterium]|nr:hypothetical protein [Betaproteobacteria bacterium]
MKPLPTNCRLDEVERCVAMTLHIDGTERQVKMTVEAAQKLYPGCDPVKELSQHSYITDLFTQLARTGHNLDTLFITSTMLDDQGRLRS